MKETFIERALEYPLECGKLVVYESNRQCANVAFKFDHHVMTMMMAGHKSILVEQERFEFFPGTFLIPQKDVIQKVNIPSASIHNPTKCLELDLDHAFVKTYYESILNSDQAEAILHANSRESEKAPKEFVSNHDNLIQTFTRLYERRMQGDDVANQMIVTLIVKELLLELFQTEGLQLLLDDLETQSISAPIRRSIEFMKKNIEQKITSKQLSEVAEMGLTSFFNRFKKEMQVSPMEYLTQRRIHLAKSFLKNGDYTLKQAAYNSGFKSYEHFCVTFKKVENMLPSEYKNAL